MIGRKKKAYNESDDIHVLYEGSKSLWRLRFTFDIFIVNHKQFQLFEIVCFSPHESKEAPRMYIKFPTIVDALKRKQLSGNVCSPKSCKDKKVTNAENITDAMIVDYITARLTVKDRDTSPEFDVFLMDVHDGTKTNITCEKPADLHPHVIHHSTPIQCVCFYIMTPFFTLFHRHSRQSC